jgi:hypothetical protein
MLILGATAPTVWHAVLPWCWLVGADWRNPTADWCTCAPQRGGSAGYTFGLVTELLHCGTVQESSCWVLTWLAVMPPHSPLTLAPAMET